MVLPVASCFGNPDKPQTVIWTSGLSATLLLQLLMQNEQCSPMLFIAHCYCHISAHVMKIKFIDKLHYDSTWVEIVFVQRTFPVLIRKQCN